VLIPAEFRRSRSLAKSERNGGFEVRFDTVFAAVMEGCAAPRARGGPGTWITPEMRSAYVELHRRGHAHSVETWRDGVLVGGLYGVQIGAAFFGESMFSTASDASKVAFSALVRRCMACGTELIDCQMSSRHLETLGCRSLPRDEFLARLTPLTALGVECRWTPGRPHD
jgi:leucyl/phenylalanyl-tRNA--protein transferase